MGYGILRNAMKKSTSAFLLALGGGGDSDGLARDSALRVVT